MGLALVCCGAMSTGVAVHVDIGLICLTVLQVTRVYCCGAMSTGIAVHVGIGLIIMPYRLASDSCVLTHGRHYAMGPTLGGCPVVAYT